MNKNYDEKKLKHYETKVLDYFKKVCDENDLSYYLAFGTLLGAIRHKGFIPWDDDIDVHMLPKDYYKLKEIMVKNTDSKYFYQSLETEKYYNLFFAKIRMRGTSAIEEKNKDEKIDKGIYIDIFPLIPYPTDDKLKSRLYNYYRTLNLFIEADLVNKSKYNSYGKVGKMLSKICKLIPRNLRNKVARKLLRKMILFDGEYENYIDLIDKKVYDKRLFDDKTEVLFENKKYSSPRDYDKYLTSVYGDYMKLPKEEDRINHSFVFVDFGGSENDGK